MKPQKQAVVITSKTGYLIFGLVTLIIVAVSIAWQSDTYAETLAGGATPTPATPHFLPYVVRYQPTATPTLTPTNTPTPTPTNTPTATPIPIIDQGNIGLETLVGAHVEDNEIHSWSFNVPASEFFVIQAASDFGADIVVTVLTSFGSPIVSQDAAGAGGIEEINGLGLGPGDYEIYIFTDNTADADYVLLMMDSSVSLNLDFRSVIGYGSAQLGSLPADTDHFWHFLGIAGQTAQICVLPFPSTDVLMALYGPDGNAVTGFVNNGGDGWPELLTRVLPSTGLYSIRVGEVSLSSGTYELRLNESSPCLSLAEEVEEK